MASRGRRGRPARLTQQGVVAAAEAVVRADGIDALSMRRVARELSCSPMALYRHVADRDDLLRLVFEHIAHTLRRPVAADDPRRTVLRVATMAHDWLAARPWAIEVLVAHRSGRPARWVTDDMLEAFLLAGLPPATAARACEVVWHQLIGELVARHLRGQPTPASAPTDVAPLARHTAVARTHDQFLHGLAALLDGLLPAA